MSLRIAVLRHEPETGLGAFADLLDEAGAHYEVVDTTAGGELPDPAGLDGAIALGGALRASDPWLDAVRGWIGDAVRDDMPFLGVCLGAQLLAAALGGRVLRGARPEVGVHDVFLTDAARRDPLFAGLPSPLTVFGWHEDTFTLPRGAVPLAGSMAYRHQAFRAGGNAYGLQFHLEARPDDVARWPDGVLEAAGADRASVEGELARAAPELHAAAGVVLARWLLLADAVAATRGGRMRAYAGGP